MFNNTVNGKDTMMQTIDRFKNNFILIVVLMNIVYNCFSIIRGYVTATECNGLLEYKLQTFFLTILIYCITV